MECIARDQRFRRGFAAAEKANCEIAGREGELLKRSDGRLVSRHLPFIAKQPCMGGDLTQVLRRLLSWQQADIRLRILLEVINCRQPCPTE